MFKRSFALLGVVALMGAGCWDSISMEGGYNGEGSVSGTVNEQPAPAPAPSGKVGTEVKTGVQADATAMADVKGTWKMRTIQRAGQAAQNMASFGATVTLDSEGRISAYVCNNISGKYSIENGRLVAAEVVSTLKFCPGLPSEVEVSFVADLAAGFSIKRSGATLMLTGGSGTVYSMGK